MLPAIAAMTTVSSEDAGGWSGDGGGGRKGTAVATETVAMLTLEEITANPKVIVVASLSAKLGDTVARRESAVAWSAASMIHTILVEAAVTVTVTLDSLTPAAAATRVRMEEGL